MSVVVTFIFTGVYSEIAFLSSGVCKPSYQFPPFFPRFPCQLEDMSVQKIGNLLIFFVNKVSSTMNVYSLYCKTRIF